MNYFQKLQIIEVTTLYPAIIYLRKKKDETLNYNDFSQQILDSALPNLGAVNLENLDIGEVNHAQAWEEVPAPPAAHDQFF